ncbi:MAG: DNA-processing protein DprA [Rhodanobacteraceae bacterium]
MNSVVFHGRDCWHRDWGGVTLAGRGDPRRLDGELTAFFASRQCPGQAIRAALKWALHQAQAGCAVVGGFHSPLERSVLELLLEARSPVVAVLARSVESARLPVAWQAAIGRGHLVVVSGTSDRRRLDHDRSSSRNELVATLASEIVVAHINPVGSLAAQVREWRRRGNTVVVLHGDCMFNGMPGRAAVSTE